MDALTAPAWRGLLEAGLDRPWTREEAARAMGVWLGGDVEPAQMAALLGAMRARGETAEELAGFAEAARAAMVRVSAPDGAIDTCGTGGDGGGTFNISTAAAFVAAAGGVPVAKHGNRSVSSRCGSADVLEALGVRIDRPVAHWEVALRSQGVAFLFAPAFHPAFRFVMPVRKAMGVRTAFNLLGPLCNPGGVLRQVIGVYHPRALGVVAGALSSLGVDRALVVCGEAEGGYIDEVSTVGPTQCVDVDADGMRRFVVTPEELGLARTSLRALRGGDAAANASAIRSVLSGESGPRGDAVAAVSGAALWVAGRCASLRDGVGGAWEILRTGRGNDVLDGLIAS